MNNRKIDWVGLSNFIDTFVKDVELYVEDEQGREGYLCLNEEQQWVVWMVLHEFINDDIFLELMGHGDRENG